LVIPLADLLGLSALGLAYWILVRRSRTAATIALVAGALAVAANLALGPPALPFLPLVSAALLFALLVTALTVLVPQREMQATYPS
jgi:hypothetical protein